MKWYNISEIRYNLNNPRTLKSEKFAKLKRSLIEFPDMLEARMLVCFTREDGKLQVIGGNQRLRALNDIGAKEVPVYLADHWTPEQRERFVIADNVNMGEWDFDELANKWSEEQLKSWGVDIPNMDSGELDDLSEQIEPSFRIEVLCKDEEHQEKTYNKLIADGLECKLLTL